MFKKPAPQKTLRELRVEARKAEKIKQGQRRMKRAFLNGMQDGGR